MKRWLSILLTGLLLLGAIPSVMLSADDALGGVVGDAKLTLSMVTDFSEDEGGSSLKITQNEIAGAGSYEERSITISLLDGTANRDLSAYSGMRFWVKNTAATALYVRTQFDIASRARTLNGMPYYLESTVDGHITEQKFAAPEVNGAWPECWSIPAGFEGFVYIPFTSLDGWGTALEINKAAKMYFWVRSVDLGAEALYLDSLGAYDGDPVLYDFEQTLSTSILTAQANTTITFTDAIAEKGNSIMATYTGTANTSVGSFNLDLKIANSANRPAKIFTGIRFWAKVTAGTGSTGTGMYLVPRYSFPNHTHYDNNASQSAPYYLVQTSGTTSYTLQKNTAIDPYSKMMFLPDDFEGWVYLPFSLNALRSSGAYIDLNNPMLALLKLAVGQAAGRNLYIDSLGFYTGSTVPTQDEQPLTLYAFTSPEVNQAAAQAVINEIQALGTITSEKADAVALARQHFGSLTAVQQALVTNRDVLEVAERKIYVLRASKMLIDFEASESSSLYSIGATGSVAVNTDVKAAGTQSLSVQTTPTDENTLTRLKLSTSGNLSQLLGMEFWMKTGDTPVAISLQADMPTRGRVYPGRYFYLTTINGETTSNAVSQQLINSTYEPLIMIPANFEGYVDVPFTTFALFDANKPVNTASVGALYLGVKGTTSFSIDAVRGSYVVAQGLRTEQEGLAKLDDAKSVESAIAQLTDVTLEMKQQVREVRTAYNQLPVDVQLLVSNLSTLKAAEARLRELKPSAYLLDFEGGALTDWTGLNTATYSMAFSTSDKFDGDFGLKITTTNSGTFMPVTFKNSTITDCSDRSGLEFYVKTSEKPAVFFMQADLPTRCLLQAGTRYYLTDLYGNILNKTVSGTNLGGTLGWCPLLTVPAYFEGFLNIQLAGFKPYDSAQTADTSQLKSMYFVFTQATTLTVDAIRPYTNLLEGVFMRDDGKTDVQAASEMDAAIDALGSITADKQGAVAGLRQQYMRLSDARKALVTRLSKLEAAEKTLQSLLKASIMNFDNGAVMWGVVGNGSASLSKASRGHGTQSLLLSYPGGSTFTLLNSQKDVSDKEGLEFWVNSSKGSALLNIQIDSPFRSYVAKAAEYYLTDMKGETVIRDVATEGIVSIPAGFKGFVNIPFTSFASYNGDQPDFSRLGCLYISLENGYGTFGQLYMDSLCTYAEIASGLSTVIQDEDIPADPTDPTDETEPTDPTQEASGDTDITTDVDFGEDTSVDTGEKVWIAGWLLATFSLAAVVLISKKKSRAQEQ